MIHTQLFWSNAQRLCELQPESRSWVKIDWVICMNPPLGSSIGFFYILGWDTRPNWSLARQKMVRFSSTDATKTA